MSKKNQEEDLSIKGLWESFLNLNGIKPGALPAIQEFEMKKTFYMACGMLHQKLRDNVSTLPQEMGILVMETQMIEIADYLSGVVERSGGMVEVNKPKIVH